MKPNPVLIRKLQGNTTRSYFFCIRLEKKKKKFKLVRVWGILMHSGETINLCCHFGEKFGRTY